MNSKEKVKELLASHKNLIEAEARKAATNLPYEVMLLECFKIAKGAAQKFDTSRDLKFSTYLVNSLKKTSRLSTDFGNVLRLPENKQFKMNKLNKIEAELQADLGRDPSISELADASGMSLKHISVLKTNKKQTVNINTEEKLPSFVNGQFDDWIHFVYHDLPDRDKLIMEHKIGFAGKPILENSEIAKKLNISPSTLSNRVKFLQNRLNEGGLHGY